MSAIVNKTAWHAWAAFLLLCAPAWGQTPAPVGELFASDAGSASSVQPAGSGMSVLSGSELSAGIAPATLKLFRGGQVRICPRSGLSVTTSGQGLMLATGAGAIEIDYQLSQQMADIVITPDFNVMLVGPGTFHFALGVSKRGDTCVKPLPGNASEVTFSELLGTGIVKMQANQPVVFRDGKLDAPAALTSECGCPPVAPVMRAEAQPSPPPVPPKENSTNSKPPDRVAVASDEPTADLLTQRLTVHEQTAWMLRSLLEE